MSLSTPLRVDNKTYSSERDVRPAKSPLGSSVIGLYDRLLKEEETGRKDNNAKEGRQ